MDFRRLNQTTFDRLSAILRLQAYHIMLFLVRVVFPAEQWHLLAREHRTRLRLRSVNTRLAVLLTANNWAVLGGHLALISGRLPRYVAIYGAVLRMPHYDRFASHAIVSFGLIEWVWLGTALETAQGRNGMLRVVLQMVQASADGQGNVDRAFGPEETRRLISGYTRRLWVSTLGLRAMIAGTVAQIGQLAVAFAAAYLAGQLHPLEVAAYLWLATAANLYGLYAMIFPAYFMTHLLFMVRLFKCRLRRAQEALLAASSGNNGSITTSSSSSSSSLAVSRFAAELMRLHHQLVLYNSGPSRHLLMYDLIFKFSGSLSVSMMVMGGGGGGGSRSSSPSTLTHGGWLILAMFAGSYAALHSVYFALAYFPRQAGALSGLLSGVAAKSGATAEHQQSRLGHQPQPQPHHQQLSTIRRLGPERLHRLLKLSSLAEFTGSSGHRFGFTYSSLYLIRTVNILENAAMNLYFLVLFYKKLN